MQTYKRLNIIRDLFNNLNTFMIHSLHSENFEIIDYKLVIFKPLQKKNKDMSIYIEEEYSNGTINKLGKKEIMSACRDVLVLIRDNHPYLVEKLDAEKMHRRKIPILWIFLTEETTFKNIIDQVKKYNRERKDNKDWDSDDIIFPKFKTISNRKYYIKDVYDGLSKDDIEFIKIVYYDGLYNDFLLSEKWNPIRLLGNQNLFSNVPLDDFGDFDPFDNSLITCAKNNSINCMSFLLMLRASPNYINKDTLTALHIAVINKNIELITLLVSYDASINIIDKYGFSPKKYAEKNGLSHCLKI